jgi:NtrC-family two-component system response regulator AlgB
MRVLIVDDESTVRLTVGVALETMGHEVSAATDSASTLSSLRQGAFDVLLLDVRLSDENGLELLGEILRLSPRLPVIVITAYASIDTAVEAMRRGAFDYVPKPCTPEQLRQALARVERARREETAERQSQAAPDLLDLEMIERSSSPAMHEALAVALKAATGDATVLLLGESGTGKGDLARGIHRRGPRAARPFVDVCCQSLSRDLLEAELFGYTTDAGGGAVASAAGKIAAAEGGTLFLDGIGDLPVEVQPRLLRLLQERVYERPGEAAPHRADVRIIAATNQNMREAVAGGSIRNDLYYCLSVIAITLPRLRSRPGDVDNLVEAHLKSFSRRYGRQVRSVSTAAMRKLRHYEWPGNLRELRNVIERAVILCGGVEVDLPELPDSIRFACEIRPVRKSTLEEVETEHIRHVLANTDSLQEASSVLGIDPTTLYRKRKRLGV